MKRHQNTPTQPHLKATAISDRGGPYTARTLDGHLFFDAAAIFPIWIEEIDSPPKLIGTGFFVTRFGHFLTAKHVLMEIYERQRPGFMFHMLDDNQSALLRYIDTFSPHQTSDVALAALKHPANYVFNSVPQLTTECPTIGLLGRCPIIVRTYGRRGNDLSLSHVAVIHIRKRSVEPTLRDAVTV